MANESKEIYVYENWLEKTPDLLGILHTDGGRGKELFSFEYSQEWLKKKESAFALDPDLQLYSGRQYAPLDKSLFGIFADSCPDRWGRMLMKRREAIQARKAERRARTLTTSDYLLGVYDESRMGALRFSLEEGGDFLSSDKELSTPPWTTLRKLENASIAFENDDNMLEERWLKQLLAPGSSLGGARPKATVMAPDDSLWIAKFPSKHDEWNSGAWEMVVHELAVMCGLNVPDAKLETFSKTGSTFLIKRFDREGKRRIHFASAMTLLGKMDGASADDGSSYLDLVSFVKSSGGNPKQDLLELWKRIVFSMLVSNTDDHLRNHGFLLNNKGWILSPMYDVNSSIYGDGLSLNINESDNSLDLALAIETAKYYGIDLKDAKQYILVMQKVVADNWKELAKKYGITRNGIEYMKPAFALAKE